MDEIPSFQSLWLHVVPFLLLRDRLTLTQVCRRFRDGMFESHFLLLLQLSQILLLFLQHSDLEQTNWNPPTESWYLIGARIANMVKPLVAWVGGPVEGDMEASFQSISQLIESHDPLVLWAFHTPLLETESSMWKVVTAWLKRQMQGWNDRSLKPMAVVAWLKSDPSLLDSVLQRPSKLLEWMAKEEEDIREPSITQLLRSLGPLSKVSFREFYSLQNLSQPIEVSMTRPKRSGGRFSDLDLYRTICLDWLQESIVSDFQQEAQKNFKCYGPGSDEEGKVWICVERPEPSLIDVTLVGSSYFRMTVDTRGMRDIDPAKWVEETRERLERCLSAVADPRNTLLALLDIDRRNSRLMDALEAQRSREGH
eukprot:Protomagalhaensia_wolfi_Nauph_80__377@NODE_1209_length_1658_cov_21_020383_g929_i0_p1_GENE_NODE_1209_length_1658_cov_21_020383_g929_i0NODE_1209_length_1658_cov_21_020383_g929_i0_p1_ORF_typecomplete_len367_score61_21Fboxlike/PF12937_7/0_013_NODE_1209_length_1658_cov_21_020383_g929_i02111311